MPPEMISSAMTSEKPPCPEGVEAGRPPPLVRLTARWLLRPPPLPLLRLQLAAASFSGSSASELAAGVLGAVMPASRASTPSSEALTGSDSVACSHRTSSSGAGGGAEVEGHVSLPVIDGVGHTLEEVCASGVRRASR